MKGLAPTKMIMYIL